MMRIVKLSDIPQLLRIYSYYVLHTAITFEYEVPSEKEFENRIQNILKRYPYLVYEENNTIKGYAYASVFKGRKAYDWSVETTIYVRQDCKRQGVGRRLYENLETALQSMGILNMNACIASPATLDAHLTDDSYHFHRRMGFTLVGRFHKSGYKLGTWYGMIWMERMIGAHKEEVEPVRFGEWNPLGTEKNGILC